MLRFFMFVDMLELRNSKGYSSVESIDNYDLQCKEKFVARKSWSLTNENVLNVKAEEFDIYSNSVKIV